MKTLKAVTVNYNTGDRLDECVGRLLIDPDIAHIIVVDNASTDNSLEPVFVRAAKNNRLQVIQNSKNQGFAAAVNAGMLTDSSANWLIINPDCMLETGVVQQLLSVLEAGDRVGMVGPLVVNPDGSEQRGCRRELPDLRTSLLRSLRLDRFKKTNRFFRGFDYTNDPLPEGPTRVPAISGAFMLVNAAAIADVGLLDDRYFLHCEDLDWFYRFAQKNWQILFVPSAKVVHYQGTSSAAAPITVELHKHKGMWRYYSKFDAPTASIFMNALVLLSIQFRFLVVAAAIFMKRGFDR